MVLINIRYSLKHVGLLALYVKEYYISLYHVNCAIVLIVFRNPYLKKGDFADNGVVDIYSNVQTHFIWQLSQ